MDEKVRKDGFIDDLLVKYLLKETKPEESAMVEEWLNTSPDHRKHYEQLQKLWKESKLPDIDSPSVDNAWDRLQQKIKKPQPFKRNTVKLRPRKWLFAASVALLILSSGVLWFSKRLSPSSELLLASQNSVITDTLPDATIVTLNKNSSLSYPKQFKGKTRTVSLNGEAFFKVTHQSRHPFVVQVGDLEIKDIGTEFNVKGNAKTTDIIVVSGIVKVSSKGRSLILKANEKVTVSQQEGILKKEKVTSNLFNYYRSKKFVCINTPLVELVKALNEAYDVNITIVSPQLNQMPITTTFHRSQSIDAILTIIGQTFHQVKVSKQDENIILSAQ